MLAQFLVSDRRLAALRHRQLVAEQAGDTAEARRVEALIRAAEALRRG